MVFASVAPTTTNLPSSHSPLSTGSRRSEKTLTQSGIQSPASDIEKACQGCTADQDEPEINIIAPWRKWVVLFVTSWCAFGATFASTSLFTAANEIAQDLDISTAAVYGAIGASLGAMGLSSFIWGPIGTIFGRRWSFICCTAVLALTTIGTALAPNSSVFWAMRILSGFEGTYFHVTGQTILAENFPPLQRGMATGIFLSMTAIGPALGPCLAGVIVTYTDWRMILWLQTAMVGLGFVLSLIFIPESKSEESMISTREPLSKMLASFSPLPVLKLLVYPNILLTDLACGLLSWSQYFLLAAPRMVIGPRFHLTEPITIGLFYLALVGGFLFGTMSGGWWSDFTVRKWMGKRGGIRLPQDRLNAGMLCFFLIIPAFQLAYGWGLVCSTCSTAMAGLAFPAITGFFVAAGLLAAFASLNTYCAEVMPKERRRVVMGKYLVQYACSAAASAGAGPLIDAIGFGLATTLGVIMVLVAGVLTLIVAKFGLRMQRWYERRFLTSSMSSGVDTKLARTISAPT